MSDIGCEISVQRSTGSGRPIRGAAGFRVQKLPLSAGNAFRTISRRERENIDRFRPSRQNSGFHTHKSTFVRDTAVEFFVWPVIVYPGRVVHYLSDGEPTMNLFVPKDHLSTMDGLTVDITDEDINDAVGT